MNILLTSTLVLCLLDLSVEVNLRENLNVLVPNNDVNLHDKLKTLINDDDIDPEDFSNNEIETLSEMKNQLIDNLLKGSKSSSSEESTDSFSSANPTEFYQTNATETYSTNTTWSYTTPFKSTFETTNSTGIFTTPFNSSIWPTTSSVNDSWVVTTEWSTTEINLNTTIAFNETTQVTTPAATTNPSTTNATTEIPSYPETQTQNTTFAESTTSITQNTTFAESTAPTSPITQTQNSTSVETTTPPSTTEDNVYEDFKSGQCLLGNLLSAKLDWVDVDGKLNFDVIKNIDPDAKTLDFSGRYDSRNNEFNSNYHDLKFLSVANNNLKTFPSSLVVHSNQTLEYLSLKGNDFSNGIYLNITMNNLKELDLRNCRIQCFSEASFKHLTSLEFVYLSNNSISSIQGHPFPGSIIQLDLSHNEILGRMEVMPRVFHDLSSMQTLDLSFTKINTDALKFLPSSLTKLSVCNSELPKATEISGSINLKYLDLSNNPSLELKTAMFSHFFESLIVLFVRESNVKTLDWAESLINLKFFDLFDNNIHGVMNTSFSRMKALSKLNLEKNSIGNWYEQIFSQNQHLKILNLRENKLTLLSNEMKTDLLSVEFLAIGKNEFQCNCILQDFMQMLFEATQNANSSYFPTTNEPDFYQEESFELNEIPEDVATRSQVQAEYFVFSRTYGKVYEMVEKSVKSMNAKNFGKLNSSPRNLIARSTSLNKENNYERFLTILFDYDEDNDEYHCINTSIEEFRKVSIVNQLTQDLNCNEEENKKLSTITILWISFTSMLVFAVLTIIIYWKWWYVKNFFVLCRNSAILIFMDSDEETERIIKGKDDEEGLEIFLYDVFVSYSDQNRQWVLDEFIPNVEKRESINVCLHERDFIVGYGVIENIVKCMDRSRCLLLLISEKFLQSQWCQFEMNLAQHRLLETRRDKLILVFLQDIPVQNQPKTLKYLMRTKTYLKWPEQGSKDEKSLFWKRLKKAIITSKWENEVYGSIA